MRIGLDLDGVGYPFVTSYKRCLEEMVIENNAVLKKAEIDVSYFWERRHHQPDTWSFYKTLWNWTTPQFLATFEVAVRDFGCFTRGAPRDGYRQAIDELRDDGHEIIIITNRKPSESTAEKAIDDTHLWLAKHNIHWDELHVSADKFCVPTDVYLDDNLANIADLMIRGHSMPLLYDRTWNQPVQPEGFNNPLSEYGHDFDERGEYRMMNKDQFVRFVRAMESNNENADHKECAQIS